MEVTYDPFAAGVLADPYPWYRWLQSRAPCYYAEERKIWVVSRYDDVVAVLRDHDRFSNAWGVGYEPRRSRDMLSADPPDHTRLRRVVNRMFLPRVVAGREQRIAQIVCELLDDMLAKEEVDLVRDFAIPLPLIVIAELLGVPPERRGDFKRWTDDLADLAGGHLQGDELARCEAGRAEFVAFLRDLLDQRRHRSVDDADDVISLLVRAHGDDGLTDAEVISLCILLIAAGNETTTNALGNGALAVVAQPDQWRAVLEDPGLIGSFSEEVLRFDSPVQGFFRTTRTAVDIAGVTIPADQRVLVLFAAANRDRRHFEQPETFLATRNPTDHVAFGNGVHHCLGAPLARLELNVTARWFAERVRAMLPAGDVHRTHTPLFRGVTSLPVTINAR